MTPITSVMSPPTTTPGTTIYPGSSTAPNAPGISGRSGTLPYNPGNHANICGGGYYHYAPVYGTNGPITSYRYTCA